MKNILFLLLVSSSLTARAQQLQFYYDFRHSLNADLNRRNFATTVFEYFKANDSTGSFLLKMQADFNGENSNVGQVYVQLSKNIRYWRPKVQLALTYTGGLGVAPPTYGYYLTNTVGIGVAYPFQWKGAWFSSSLTYRYSAFPKPSHDPQLMFYFGRGFFNYRLFIAGSLTLWSENRNQGNDFTKDLQGKKVAFYSDPQAWVKLTKTISVGTRVNLYYHILTNENWMQAYPTLGVKNQF